jgi:hypothetical protein
LLVLVVRFLAADAGDAVVGVFARVNFLERGRELPTLLDGERAPVGERTLGHVAEQLWRVALDHFEVPLGVPDVGERALQQEGVGVARRVVDVADGAALGELAGVHHAHPVTGLEHQADVVGDQQHARREFLPGDVEVLEHLVLHDDVEGGRRLVRDDQRRLQKQRERDQRALLHAAGELVWVLRRAFALEAHHFEHVAEFPADLLVGEVAVAPANAQRLLVQPHHRVQAAHRPLRDPRDLLPPQFLAQFPFGEVGDVLPAVADRARRDLAVAREAAHDRHCCRALPGAGLADQPEVLALVDRKRDVRDRRDRAGGGVVPDREIVDLKQLFRHC